MRQLSLILLAVFTSPCCGQDVFAQLKANTEALSAAPCKSTCPCKGSVLCTCAGGWPDKCACKACTCAKREEPATNWPSYEQACAARKARGAPIVIFVGCTPRNVDRCAVAAEVTFVDCPKPCIVVGTVEGWRYDLPASATDAEIWVKAFSPPPVQAPVRAYQPAYQPAVFAPAMRGGSC